MTTLFGISNCDTVKKARKWLETNQHSHRFHDFRKDGIERQQVIQWVSALGWETLVNKRSTTWKTLDEQVKSTLTNDSVVEVILQHPTLIKRPLLELNGLYNVGFKETDYQQLFGS